MSEGQDQTVKELLEQNRELMKMLANRGAAEAAPAPATAVQAAAPQQVAAKPWVELTRPSNGAVPMQSVATGLPAGIMVALRLWIEEESYDLYTPLHVLAELDSNPQLLEAVVNTVKAAKNAQVPMRKWSPEEGKKTNKWRR